MKNVYSILITICVFVTYGKAQQNPLKTTITLSGYLAPGSLIKPADSLEVYFFNDYDHRLFERPVIYKSPIINGAFKLQINSTKRGYLMILNLYLRSLHANLFLVNPGDRLHLTGLGAKQFRFTGRGAAAMNYQQAAGKLLYTQEYKFREDINDTAKIDYLNKKEHLQINTCLNSLGELKTQLSRQHYQELSSLSIYAIKGMTFYEMASFADINDTQYKKVLETETERRLAIEKSQPEQGKQKNTDIFSYLFYLTDLNKILLNLRYGTSKYPFKAGLDLIRSQYSATLRDRLLLQYFGMNKQVADVPQYLTQAISLMKEVRSKHLLQQMADARLPGSPVYPFSFQDSLGVTTRLSDLKGKVVLIDSWYKGCINCSILKKQMEPVTAHFKNDSNMVFLSLNVDRDKKRFIEGIKSGLYTDPASLNLYTNGLGPQHPMLRYYQYNGYPNLLLMDQQGRVISANPPRPSKPEKMTALIKLIESNLHKNDK